MFIASSFKVKRRPLDRHIYPRPGHDGHALETAPEVARCRYRHLLAQPVMGQHGSPKAMSVRTAVARRRPSAVAHANGMTSDSGARPGAANVGAGSQQTVPTCRIRTGEENHGRRFEAARSDRRELGDVAQIARHGDSRGRRIQIHFMVSTKRLLEQLVATRKAWTVIIIT